ncbi:MAG: carbamoyltransferase HypF [Planctomycetota bacterium]
MTIAEFTKSPSEQASAMPIRQTVEIRVRGTVQGVGFRPTVWRLACDDGLVGEVFNDGFGVMIRITATRNSIANFLARLQSEAPPLSQIEEIQTRFLPETIEFSNFCIVESQPGENRTRVTPDAAICPACRSEVFDSDDRRFQYPFANCTHCGPRFSIVTSIPYDRPNTTMAPFPMCDDCRKEYENPADRRFHAQPIACPTCGPTIWLESWSDSSGQSPRGTAALQATTQLLCEGQVIAIRGLGGFHLACDATNSAAVTALRNRKRRFGKPFALMARDIQTISRYCLITPDEAALLQSPEAPIVLLNVRDDATLPEGIAPGLNVLGFMLPYTPLHMLILQQFDRPLVMTSGNISNEPQITDRVEARSGLQGIADAVLMHDREIANRIDDSVVRMVTGQPRLIRRARGYAPSAITLPEGFEDAPDLLAFGAELKSTFCLIKDGAAILSQHQGDLEDVATFEDYQKNLRLYTEMYDHRPSLLVTDLHPEYLSTKLGRIRSAETSVPLVEIQHHHAHIASCLIENRIPRQTSPVLGISLDGVGLGDDRTIWGAEFLLADYCDFQRLGTFKPVAMPGGAQAIREPWRNTYAHLVAAFGVNALNDQLADLPVGKYLATKPLATIDRMLERGLNVPLASSCGRLFDAVAAAVGICSDQALFEGQGAMELEALAVAAQPYPFAIELSPDGLLILDPTPMWASLLEDLRQQTPVSVISGRFQQGLAEAIRDMVIRLHDSQSGKATFDTVVLSGGCFQNACLLAEVSRLIEVAGLTCLTHSKVPANDGGLALGQAAIAAARQITRSQPMGLQSGASTKSRSFPCVLESPAR